MTTLFDSRLSDRDYASYLLHVGDLVKWAETKRLHLQTAPNDMHEFVQVEALLSAIERHANNVTPEQALNIVLNDPVLKNDPVIQKYPDDIDPTTCRWLLGAEAHRKWRDLLYSAIATGELTLLDFGSKLPVNIAPTENTATPAPVVATGEWVTQAQARAREIVRESKERDRYPSQENLGDTIAAEFRKAGIVGTDGKPLSGATVKRHALKGISSATGKQLSTTIGRGK